MLKLITANLKMTLRNRQALFWSLMFPIIFTVIFGFFFGQGSSNTGTVVLVNRSESQIAQKLEKALKKSALFKIEKRQNLETSKIDLKNNKITGIIEVPTQFGTNIPGAPTKIKVISDQANLQTNVIILNFLNQFLTQLNFQSQNIQPRFGLEEEKSISNNLTYFDFILIGLLGMALMNSSIQNLAISLSRYKESKIFKRLTVTPLPSWKFITAEVLSRLIINLIQITLILFIGVYAFQAHLYGNLFLLYLFSLIGAILFQAMGFVVAAFSRTTAAAESMATAITIPMMFLAGVFFPIDQLPLWLSSIVKFLPLAPLLRMIRQIALEDRSPFTNLENIFIVLAWIIVMLVISVYKFRFNEE